MPGASELPIGTGRNPGLAATAGGFFSAWTEGTSVVLERPEAARPEVVGDGAFPAITALPSGSLVPAWNPGARSQFKSFPAAVTGRATERSAGERAPFLLTAPPSSGQSRFPPMAHVLVADDIADERELFATSLRLGGWTVTAVETTEAVLAAAFSSSPPDVFLLDLVLDRADGLAVVQTLRSDPRTATIPIVAITAATPRYVEEVALAVGCTAYLTKPCPPDVVAEVLRSAIAGRRPAPGLRPKR